MFKLEFRGQSFKSRNGRSTSHNDCMDIRDPEFLHDVIERANQVVDAVLLPNDSQITQDDGCFGSDIGVWFNRFHFRDVGAVSYNRDSIGGDPCPFDFDLFVRLIGSNDLVSHAA